MKKYVIFAALAATIVSCSDDDNNNGKNEEFFNLKEGNMWVYNRYHSDQNGENPKFSYLIDTLQVAGKKQVNGEEYTHT